MNTYLSPLMAIVAMLAGCSSRAVGYDPYLFVCGSGSTVYLLSLDSEKRTTVAGPANVLLNYATRYRWSPDGSKVLIADRYVLQLDLLGISEFPLPGLLKGWSPDGQWVWLYEADTGRVLQVRPDGSSPQTVAEIAVIDSDDGPYVSANGERMVWFGEDPATGDSTGLYVQDLPDGQPHALHCESVDPLDLAYSFETDTLWSVDGGSLLWIASDGTAIYRCDVNTGEVDMVASYPEYMIGRFKQSPDGRNVAYDTFFPMAGRYDLYVVELETGQTVRLTDGWRTTLEAWTYDSKYIVFMGEDPYGREGPFAVSIPGGKIDQVEFPQDADQYHICGPPIEPCPVPRSLSELGQ